MKKKTKFGYVIIATSQVDDTIYLKPIVFCEDHARSKKMLTALRSFEKARKATLKKPRRRMVISKVIHL